MRVLVAHPAQQHSYRLAASLKRAGLLERYATTVYYKKGKSLTWVASQLLKGTFRAKAEGRTCTELNDADVIQFCEGEGLLKLIALNTPLFKGRYRDIKYHTADRFAKRAAKYAIRHQVDAVITYDDSSPILFEILKEQAPHIRRIMDMSAASILYMRGIYEKDFELAPAFAERLRKERAICWDTNLVSRTKREIEATQDFLVPSDFVARSLAFSGVKPEQMHRCPYGVDLQLFKAKEYDKNIANRPIRFVYVGGVKELKGISYLLQAIQSIPPELAELLIVGENRFAPDIELFTDRVQFTGMVLHEDVPKYLSEADVFVFPSLGDSYGLSVMEAAACGLPLIVTENTGVSDMMENGQEGFVIPVQSVDALRDKMMWFLQHPEEIHAMGRAARKMAERNTWDCYYQTAAETTRQILMHTPTCQSEEIAETNKEKHAL